VSMEPPYVQTIPRGESRAFTFDVWLVITPRNGEVAPDLMDFKVKKEPAEVASLVPFLLAREYEFTHTLTEHYDYYPIIFLHGMNATGESWFQPAWEDGYDDSTALEKVLNNHYREYRLGSISGQDNILDREETPLPSIGSSYPKRMIYVVEYYKAYYHPGTDADSQGVIGSNEEVFPSEPGDRDDYNQLKKYGEYGKVVGYQIKQICKSTYSDKVHIVAHSMGGMVARSAIKYYGCENCVNRVLMLATPNNGCHYSDIQQWAIETSIIPKWTRPGEAAELKVRDVKFNRRDSGGENWWYVWLNQGDWPGAVEYATIAGILNDQLFGLGPADGIVDPHWVHWGAARFNAVHYSAHSSAPAGKLWFFGAWDTKGASSLIANELTTEYIKHWVIDGDESKTGEIRVSRVYFEGIENNILFLQCEFESLQDFNLLSVQCILYGRESGNPTWHSVDVVDASYRQGVNVGGNWWRWGFKLNVPENEYEEYDEFGVTTIFYNLEGIKTEVP